MKSKGLKRVKSKHTDKVISKLLSEAKRARNHAHSPYSGFKVGAAIIDNNGKIYSGCNVENSTYGATVCAERTAIGNMVSHGGKLITDVVVVTADSWLPCGICRQVLHEFAADPKKVFIHIANLTNGIRNVYTLDELLPVGFSIKDLNVAVRLPLKF